MPAFSQNVRSSAAVVASSTVLGSFEREDATSLVLETAQLHLASAVVDHRRLGEPQTVQLARIREPG